MTTIASNFTRYQRQQFARLLRGHRYIHGRAERSIDRGDPLWRVYRRLRRGVIEVLRAALFEAGDKLAGSYRWLALIERAAVLIPATPEQRDALTTLAAMPFCPEEPQRQESRDERLRFLAACHHHQFAAWAVEQMAGPVSGKSIGIRDGRWLRLSSGKTCVILRWNGIVALLGDSGARDVMDYFDLFGALNKDRLVWIDDAQEIARLNARLVSPLPANYWQRDDDKACDEETGADDLSDEVEPDPQRTTMVSILACNIAGLYYHHADKVAHKLLRGTRLQLLREPDNAFDTEAIAVLTDTGDKLGYVPRRCNAGIARRLDAGVSLMAWLVKVEWRAQPFASQIQCIDIDIRSPDLHDVPDVQDEGEQINGFSALTSAQSHTRSYWPTKFAFNSLDKARRPLGRGDLGEMLTQVDTACNWGREAYLYQQGLTPETGNGWHSMTWQFDRVTRSNGLGSELALLRHELGWRSNLAPCGERDTALALCLLRIELLWRLHLTESSAPARGAVLVISLPPQPALRPPPETPLAQRYTPLRRIQALQPLRRLLQVIQRTECGLPASTADLRCLRLFNRDRALVRALLRQLAHALREEMRAVLKPAQDGSCWEPSQELVHRYPALYANSIPNTTRWQLVNEAAALLEAETPDLPAIQALRVQLYLRQPETRRIRHQQRRHASDHDLFATEQLLQAAEIPDMQTIVNGTCVATPMDRRNRLLSNMLWRLFDALSAELFGRRRVEMLRNYPVLLAGQAPPLDFAIMAWDRAMTDTPVTDVLAPVQSAARILLLEALVCHRGPWPQHLDTRIPAMEQFFPL